MEVTVGAVFTTKLENYELLRAEAQFGYLVYTNQVGGKDFEKLLETFLAENNCTLEQYEHAHRVNRNRNMRAYRLRRRTKTLIESGKAVFLTLTFTDKVLSSTTAETRRRYVQRYLNDQCDFYCANIDFGFNNGREHYHAIVNDRIDLSAWAYGSVNAQRIRTHSSDVKRTAKYITKVTRHQIKESTGKAWNIIYSR